MQTQTALFTTVLSANTGNILKLIHKISQKANSGSQLAQSDGAQLTLVKALTPMPYDDLTPVFINCSQIKQTLVSAEAALG